MLCVGGLSVGGAGRTPVVTWLAEQAHAAGRRVAILGHGYRGHVARPTRVASADACRWGDEAAALFRRLPQIPLWVGPDRGATLAAMPADHLILTDGGLLDPRLPRHTTLLLIDASASTRVLPAGPLRAPLDRVPADHRWVHRCDEGRFEGAAAVRSAVRLVGIRDAAGVLHPPEWLQDRPVRVLCGIARPGSFLRLLRRHGARIVEQRLRGDHAWFSARDRAALGPDWIVTTKDRARLPTAPGNTAVTSLAIHAGDPLSLLPAACGA